MRRLHLFAIALLIAPLAGVSALTPPSKSDGPVRLLACVVAPNGTLEAEVDNQTDDIQACNIRCNYAVGDTTFSNWFEVSIPKRFVGRVGRFDTNGGKAGSYSGDISRCQKVSAR